jgi:hypothetical protein
MATFSDFYGFEFKAKFWAFVLESIDADLPSYRAAKINIANLERLVKKFDRTFPPELLETISDKNLRQRRGQYKQRVAQNDKLVDKSIRKLIEEMVIRDFEKEAQPGAKKITPKKIRGGVQKYVARTNQAVNKQLKKTLLESAITGLSGIKEQK